MKTGLMKRISGWSLFGLGCIHQLVHILFTLSPEQPPIVKSMMDFKIQMMGEHSLFEFHAGFSLLTGFFLIFLGLIIALLSKTELPKKVNYVFMGAILSMIIVSVVYIHALAYGVSIISFLFFIGSLKPGKQVSLA